MDNNKQGSQPISQPPKVNKEKLKASLENKKKALATNQTVIKPVNKIRNNETTTS